MEHQQPFNATKLSLKRVVMAKENHLESTDDGSVVGDETKSCSEQTNNVMEQKKATTDAKIAKGARAFVMMVLFLSAVIVASLAYILFSRSEQDAFQTAFESSSRQAILMANRNAMNVFSTLKTFAGVFPAAAQAANITLPFLTLSGYAAMAEGFCNVSKAMVFGYVAYLRTKDDMLQWNSYSSQNSHWLAEGYQFEGRVNESSEIIPYIFAYDNLTGEQVPEMGNGPYAATWTSYPAPTKSSRVNFNLLSKPDVAPSLQYVAKTAKPIVSKPIDARLAFKMDIDGPISTINHPVFNTTNGGGPENVVAFLGALLAWKTFLEYTLPPGQNNIYVVIDSCNEMSTFQIDGPESTFIGYGDLHHRKYDTMKISDAFVSYEGDDDPETACQHRIHLYPTPELEDTYKTNRPLVAAAVVIGIFLFAALVFLAYDWFVTNRQSRTERQADQSNAIVQELFPGDTANRLFGDPSRMSDLTGTVQSTDNKSSGFGKVDRSTIADLYPEVTVLFADISGFTAWSSMRDAHQVFTLLESIFQAFDKMAKKCGAFKVETIGDCYVAACGVPKENPYHAIAMCRFARGAMSKFRAVCRSLELTLGPDTSDLSLRIGMHSGPVTAGVLRGDRARFQLFGDTVNTASRIESTGKRGRVHLSEQTANELIKHGKDDWIVRREDAVEAKGKGKIVTYWLRLTNRFVTPGSVTGGSVVGEDEIGNAGSNGLNLDTSQWNVEMPAQKSVDVHDQIDRLVQWNSDLLVELLRRVVSRRLAVQSESAPVRCLTEMERTIGNGSMVVDEVAEIIDMPELVCTGTNAEEATLSEEVENQLRGYITEVASMYNPNPFHNFEHASHVTMSIHKLLTRIVAPKLNENVNTDNDQQQEALLHDYTYGITSDPLTQFAVVLSGLIHDLDHPGVSNGQLVKENPALGSRYQEKSVAEQNSVDLAWSILMSSAYDELRDAIYATPAELQRFRSLLVNSVIATDIFDKDQSTLRKNRWNKAFFETTPDDTSHVARSRKATIVIEHLIQASDVAHTMQHWHVYQKWNQRLFNEMMMAYRAGRSEKDPSLSWYGGELWFFDNYVIPLTKKLKDCGVFGVSSDEYLNYALHNRDEWESKGQTVVQQYLEEFERFEVVDIDSNIGRLVI